MNLNHFPSHQVRVRLSLDDSWRWSASVSGKQERSSHAAGRNQQKSTESTGFWDWVSIHSPGWPQTQNLLASVSHGFYDIHALPCMQSVVVCVYVCVLYMCHVDMLTHLHVRGQRLTVASSALLSILLWDEDSRWTWSSPILPDKLAASPGPSFSLVQCWE